MRNIKCVPVCALHIRQPDKKVSGLMALPAAVSACAAVVMATQDNTRLLSCSSHFGEDLKNSREVALPLGFFILLVTFLFFVNDTI